MIDIKSVTLGIASTNAYIIASTNGVIVIDPCIMFEADAVKLSEAIAGRHVAAIMLTHGHFDHIAGVDVLVDAYNCPVYMYAVDLPMLRDPSLNGSFMIGKDIIVNTDPIMLDHHVFNIDGVEFEMFNTPGHTAGSVSYLIHRSHFFVGDFIMHQAIGRTDLPTGSMDSMFESLTWFKEYAQDKVLTLYSGHGPITTSEVELRVNPYLK